MSSFSSSDERYPVKESSIEDLFEFVVCVCYLFFVTPLKEKASPLDVLQHLLTPQQKTFHDLYYLGDVVGRGGFGTIYEVRGTLCSLTT